MESVNDQVRKLGRCELVTTEDQRAGRKLGASCHATLDVRKTG